MRYVLSAHISSDDKLTSAVSVALELPMTRVPGTKIICSFKHHCSQLFKGSLIPSKIVMSSTAEHI